MREQTCERRRYVLCWDIGTTIFIKLRHRRNESNTVTREDIIPICWNIGIKPRPRDYDVTTKQCESNAEPAEIYTCWNIYITCSNLHHWKRVTTTRKDVYTRYWKYIYIYISSQVQAIRHRKNNSDTLGEKIYVLESKLIWKEETPIFSRALIQNDVTL